MYVVQSSALRLSHMLAGVCLMGSLTLPVVAQGSHKPHKESKRADTREIEALEAQWRNALVKSDTTSLDKLLADDFFGISSNGTVSDKQQYIHRIAGRENEFTSIDLMDIKVRMQPTTAIAVSQARVTGELGGRPISGIFRYTKVYGRGPSGWRLLNFEATRVSGPRVDAPELERGTPISSVGPSLPDVSNR